MKTFIILILTLAIVGLIALGIVVSKNKKLSVNSKMQESSAVDPVNETDHIAGDKNAPITLIEYSDYQCPYCVTHYPTMKKIMSEYPGKVRWVFRSFPLPFHQAAKKASEAAEAASAQGKFWEYSDKLIENSKADGKGLEEPDLIRYAEELGLNMDQFKSDLASGKYADKVKKDTDSGTKAGITGTPATFLIDKNGNAELLSGALPIEQFRNKIDEALNK